MDVTAETSHESSGWLYNDAPKNMKFMDVTDETSHEFSGWLNNDAS